MITISLCMIVKNEEKTLSRCLESVKSLVDEIVIVDTGSIDNTKNIAKLYTNKVYDFKWIDDFSVARNYSFSKGTKDYLMWLDADDVIEKEDFKKFIDFKKSLDKNIDMVMMKYISSFNEGATLSYYRERIVKREKSYNWIDPVHEVIPIDGNVLYKEINVMHKKIDFSNTSRNLEIYNKMINDGKKLNERQKFYYSRELYYNKKYTEAVKSFEEFLTLKSGFNENLISACKDLSYIYYMLDSPDKALISLFRSFEFDLPRSEFASDIAKHFSDRNDFTQAIYWYNIALNSKKDETTGGFYNIDYYYFIPYLGLAYCYYKTGELELSNKYNEMAGKIKPDDKIYLQNKQYFLKTICL